MDLPLTTAGLVIGGVGLLLLAVHMIAGGLKIAGGEMLRAVLGGWTRSSGGGLFSGIVISALMQSSRAVTVATIGFVNAGLLSLRQAQGALSGASIGATATGWLVAAAALDARVHTLALLLIGIGMLLALTGPQLRRGAFGEALAGFGLFFLGIDVLSSAFNDIAGAVDLQQIFPEGAPGLMLYILAGFAVTVLTQSASVAVAVILSAASGNLLSLPAAAAAVVGASIGVTPSAALSVAGATAGARRVATAQTLLNGFTALIGLALLPLVFSLVQGEGKTMDAGLAPVVLLALFYTAFNVLGVLLLWLLTRRLGRWLEGRFRAREKHEDRPRYLDHTLAEMPTLAMRALVLELYRVAALARRVSDRAMNEGNGSRELASERDAAVRLCSAIDDFAARLQRGRLIPVLADRLMQVLRAADDFRSVSETAKEMASFSGLAAQVHEGELLQLLSEYRDSINAFLDRADPLAKDFRLQNLSDSRDTILLSYQPLKRAVLMAGVNDQLRVSEVAMLLDYIRGLRSIVEQTEKGTRDIIELMAATGGRGKVPAAGGETASADQGPEPSSAPAEPDRPAGAEQPRQEDELVGAAPSGDVERGRTSQ
ncbi:MAG: Na/Pi symporter [Gammaproteobacteria bacterium]|jgi:phosphate:Na+ symporter